MALRRRALLVLALAAAPLRAEESPLALEGRGLRDLAAHPLIALPLRSAAQGRSGTVFERLSLPGAPVRVAEARYVYATGCGPAGCARDGILLGFDVAAERLYLLVVDGGRPVLVVPPHGTPWPGAFRAAVEAFRGG